jgi:diamine N-acetyltransferase
MKVFFDYAFRQLNLSRIWLEVLVANERAVELYRRFGFVHEGTLRSHHFQDGQFKDLHVMGLLRAEFEERSKQGGER